MTNTAKELLVEIDPGSHGEGERFRGALAEVDRLAYEHREDKDKTPIVEAIQKANLSEDHTKVLHVLSGDGALPPEVAREVEKNLRENDLNVLSGTTAIDNRMQQHGDVSILANNLANIRDSSE